MPFLLSTFAFPPHFSHFRVNHCPISISLSEISRVPLPPYLVALVTLPIYIYIFLHFVKFFFISLSLKSPFSHSSPSCFSISARFPCTSKSSSPPFHPLHAGHFITFPSRLASLFFSLLRYSFPSPRSSQRMNMQTRARSKPIIFQRGSLASGDVNFTLSIHPPSTRTPCSRVRVHRAWRAPAVMSRIDTR